MTVSQQRKSVPYPYVLLCFFSLISLPGFLSNIGFASNHSLGLLISLIPIFLTSMVANHWIGVPRRDAALFFILLLLVLGHFVVSSLLWAKDYDTFSRGYSRFLLAFIFLGLLLWSISQIEKFITALKEAKFTRLISTIYWSLVALVFASLPFHLFDWVTRKQMLIFSEPSHFAIIFCPFLLYQVLVSRHKYKHLLLSLSMAFMLQSVTLIAVSIIGGLVSVKRYGPLQILILSALGLLIATFAFHYSRFFIFIAERNVFASGTENLTALVFLSGIEAAYLTFFRSFALGVGFQQMGLTGPHGEFQSQIINLTGRSMNLYDGSILISKIVSEFGMIGLLLSFAYLVKATQVFNKSRSSLNERSYLQFYRACYLSFSVLLFVRSPGYFSPSTVIFLLALLGLRRAKYCGSQVAK